MNLDTLRVAPFQDIFSHVLKKLSEQQLASGVWGAITSHGEIMSGKSTKFFCQYRSKNGACAIGHCMSDHDYYPALEGKTALGLPALQGISETRKNFLLALQNAHDAHFPRTVQATKADWLASMRNIAEIYHLEFR